MSELAYAPLAKYLTNVSHLIICPDGQLSRLPFEMLPFSLRSDATGPVGNKFLLEEKTISYVTSGREIVRLAQTSSKFKVPSSKSLVMGNPDFDLDLPGSSRREEALTSQSKIGNQKSEIDQSLLTSAATELSRSFHGFKFTPLPSAAEEARTVAKLLGDDAVLKLGAEARESELKAVVSPRVLHLATHGFFLSDQEFKHTNSPRDSLMGNFGTRWNASLPQNDWENPLVRCGIALAGANHATNLTNRSATKARPEASEPDGGCVGVGDQPQRVGKFEAAAADAPTPHTAAVRAPVPGQALTSQSKIENRKSKIEEKPTFTSAATNEEDGVLTGLEASLLHLQGTELVILSACDSGSGELKIGEGVMSLRRAFRIAGAESVLASHWKVSDQATSKLMTEFMRRWQAGEPRAKAWREAQLSLLRSKGAKEDFSNPFYWAAFTLTGQWN